jgi:hypothetical protein
MGHESDNDEQPNPAQPTDVEELRSFTDASSASLAKASLEARGIECWLTADDCGGMLAAMDAVRGVKLLVRRSDSEAAKALLSADSAAGQPMPDEAASGSPAIKNASPRIKFSLPQLTAGVVAGVLLCLLYQWTDKLGTKTYRFDSDGDGKADEVWVYQNGRYVESSYDRNADGRLDSWNYFDSNGRRTLARADDNFDGQADVTWSYTNGGLSSMERDTDFNGTPDSTTTFLHDLPAQTDWRPNGTNILTHRQFFRHGVLSEEWWDTNMDGSFDVTIQYDAFEKPIGTNAFRLLPRPAR